ncbi:hypothetical protein B296_00029579 [Ensete ventricosum]|uniref:glycerophosphodiester phosphodiesterase n=1 Tax=Ensete ventricosum TaxID=4639 RepID=A0A426YRF1_ENSVE|nr:hypothetical protein B296_00029579 [Ensete ventricosum]
MALKAVQMTEVPSLHQVPDTPPAVALLPRAAAAAAAAARGFVVLGHRGKGMNALESADLRMRAVKENSLLSFNRAALFPIDFVEFDVQGKILEKHVTDLYLEEFLSYVLNWNVDDDDSLCTLQEAFEKIDSRLGFNIELKFIDHAVNVPEAVYMQHLMGIDGVIVDLVEEITEAVSDFITPTSVAEEHEGLSDAVVEPRQVKVRARPNFSQRELSFLLKLIPELVQQ